MLRIPEFKHALQRAAFIMIAVPLLALGFASPVTLAVAQVGTPAPTTGPLPLCRTLPTTTPQPGPTATNTPTATPTSLPATASSPTPTSTIPPTPTVNPNAGYLGIAAEQVEQCGARVLEVKADSGADKANVQAGDVIVAVEGKPITGVADLRDAVRNKQAGDKLKLTLQRGTNQLDLTVTLGAIPQSTTATQAATQAATPAR
jgi:membrane-associated protease RseP (regulator of RpoE activity)